MPFDAKGAKGAGKGVMGVITKKIGPLPLWSYVVIGGVLVFILRKRGAGSASGGGIGIPVLTPGGSGTLADGTIGQGGNAVGSPNQNAMAGADTQPGGAPPWWSTPPSWFTAVPAGAPAPGPAMSSPGTNPGGATPGPLLPAIAARPTAGALAAEPAGGWTAPPAFQQISPSQVLDTSGGQRGVVNPNNRLLGYSNPKTGELSQTPVPGWAAIWA